MLRLGRIAERLNLRARSDRFGSYAIIALLALLSVESAGALFFLWQTGSWVYVARQSAPIPASTTQTPAARTPAEAFATFAARLHPYFGFAGPYEGELGGLYWNALGSLQRAPLAIPYVPKSNDIVVVIFGGSVAASLVVAPNGGLPLDLALKKSPLLQGRNVIVVAAAISGGKQPQQLFRLAYLLAIGQHIDLIINVDGFNEFALGQQNIRADLDPVLPAAQNMRPMLSRISQGPATEEFYDIAHQLYASRRAVAHHSAQREQARTGIGYAWATVQEQVSRRQLARVIGRHEKLVSSKDWGDLKPLFSLDLPRRVASGDPTEMLYDLWLRSSQQMRALATGNGIPYVHIIQPNQYYSKHRFSDGERSVALSIPSNHEFRVGAENGYKLLAAREADLSDQQIISAVDLFDGIDEEVYADNCCHYNARGETIFAEYIAGAASSVLAKNLKKSPKRE